MKIKSIMDKSFSEYGQIITGYNSSPLIKKLDTITKPEDKVEYVASCEELESLAVFKELRDRQFGGLPIQIGYCVGSNTKLNCFEYHRNSEVNIYATEVILLLGYQQDIVEGKYHTSKVEAYRVPAGFAVELYATTLHYAPCDAKKGSGFRVAVVLPKGTNTDKPTTDKNNLEDSMLFAKNKWLLSLPETAEARQGAYVGLSGQNIDLANII